VNLIVIIVAVALLFDYFNGFNDAANSVATVVATKVLTPLQAVAWAAFFNFAAAFTVGTAVAKTIGQGMVNLDYVTPLAILGGLVGAIFLVATTSFLGLPVSASHALVGGYAGSAMSRVAQLHGLDRSLDAVILAGWVKPLAFIAISPVLGLLLSGTFMVGVYWLFRNATPQKMDSYFRKLQLVSAAVFSYSHGANDAQKTMGIIAGALVAGGYLQTFEIPVWVIFSAYGAIALGTLMGGWKVIETMGSRITRLKPREGFCAETAGAASILFATALGQPVSTTHTIAGAIAGVGVVRRVKAVRWHMAQRIVVAWLLTIPCAAAVGWVAYRLLAALLGST